MRKYLSAIVIAAVCAGAATQRATADATTITKWDFDAHGPVGPIDDQGLPTDAPYFGAGAIYNTPLPTTGNGVATALGMDNNYTYLTTPNTIGSVTACDVLSQGSVDGSYVISVWRVRGPSNAAAPPGNGNGWNTAAPQYTQGAQFSVDTTNYSGIRFFCQVFTTNQGVRNGQAQYTLNGTTWTNIGSVFTLKPNDYMLSTVDSTPASATNFGINLDFTGIPAAENNPNFGVRLVSCYDPMYVGEPTTHSYTACNAAVSGGHTSTVYNNNSGNWRFGQVIFTGTATGPTSPVARASSTLSAVCAADPNPVTFTIVVQPGSAGSPGTTVTADLSQIGITTPTTSDNMLGTAFSFSGTIPAGFVMVPNAPVSKTVTFTATDSAGRTATSSVAVIFVNCSGNVGSPNVVISQVYGGGGLASAAYKNDYVELFNRGLSPQNLSGWSIQYASAAGTSWLTTPLTNFTLNPGQYYLVQLFSGGAIGATLPAADAIGTTDMSTTAGKVALCNTATALTGSGCPFGASVVDFVGYGATASCSEAFVAPAPSVANAIYRVKGGCIDTNNNSTDFAAAAAAPRNSASSINASSEIVISQVYGGGSNPTPGVLSSLIYDSDFIEIYNRSEVAVSLNNCSVQYASPTSGGGFSSANNLVALSGTIQPHQYMLVRFSDASNGFRPIPTPDFSTVYGKGGIGNTGGRVALVRHTNGVVAPIATSYVGTNGQFVVMDLVGYGSSTITFEGAGPAGTTDNTHAVIRKGATFPGDQDTDQNFNDFTVGSPNPHNRASNGTTNFLTAYPSIPTLTNNSVVVTNAACAGSVVSLRCNVTPGSASTNIMASADVSAITGVAGSVSLYDDNTHGDAFAGDNIFSLDYTIPPGAAQGVRTITFHVTDMQGGTYDAPLTIDIGNCVDPGTGPSGSPVVISEVFGGGAHYDYVPQRDFIEIYNRSSAPVDITNWRMEYCDASGNFTAAKTVVLSGTMGAGERRIVSGNLVNGIGFTIPTPDFIPVSDFGFDNQYGRIALVMPSMPGGDAPILVATNTDSGFVDPTGLVDLVGYGAVAPTYEGVAPAPTLANGTYLVRKNNGNQDFNQNIIDFDDQYVLVAPRSTRTLYVSKNAPATTGTPSSVSSDIGGISCGATCSAVYDRGTTVTLTATAGSKAKFTGWSGACSGTGPCQVSVSDTTNVTANFGCAGDFNNSGSLEVQDIFDFLNAWFGGCLAVGANPCQFGSADFNGSGLAVSDIFDFLNAWFAGC